MKKATLCCCFTWIVFIELNLTVVFLLIRKTWDYRFAGKVEGWGVLRNGGNLVVEGWFWNGGNTSLCTMRFSNTRRNPWFQVEFYIEQESFLGGACESKNSSNMSKNFINNTLVFSLFISRVICQLIFHS